MLRMYMIPATMLCRKHLRLEHSNCHALLKLIGTGTTFDELIEAEYIQPMSLFHRHSDLAFEMLRRGMKHNSPLLIQDFVDNCWYLQGKEKEAMVDVLKAKQDLLECPCCDIRISWVEALIHDYSFSSNTCGVD